MALPLDVLLDGPRPGADDPDADRAWLVGRRAIDRLTVGTTWDARQLLMAAADWREWQARRRAWLAEHLDQVSHP